MRRLVFLSAWLAPLCATVIAGCEWISGYDGARAAGTTHGGADDGGASDGAGVAARCSPGEHTFCLDFESGSLDDVPFDRDVRPESEVLAIVPGGANGSAGALRARIAGATGARRALLTKAVNGDFQRSTMTFDFRSPPATWPDPYVGTTFASVTFFSGVPGATERVYVALTLGASGVNLFIENGDTPSEVPIAFLVSDVYARLVLRVIPGPEGGIEIERDGAHVHTQAFSFAVNAGPGASTRFEVGLVRGNGAGADLEAYYDNVVIDRGE